MGLSAWDAKLIQLISLIFVEAYAYVVHEGRLATEICLVPLA